MDSEKSHIYLIRKDGLSRRSFIGWLIGFSAIASLAEVLAPIIGYLLPARAHADLNPGRVLVGTLNDFPPDTGTVLPVADNPVIITNPQSAGPRAFSAICTHLGCVVHWHETGTFIQCPCHDGRFNAQTGAVISGPPPRPLPPYELTIEGDSIYVGRPKSPLFGGN